MKLILTFILFYHSLSSFAIESKSKTITKNNINATAQMGPVYRSPVSYNNQLYMLASSGTLFKADKNLKKLKALFQTEKKTISGILLKDDILYFGDGLHEDRNSFLYGFDLKKEKLLFKSQVNGHIEKYPIAFNKSIIFSAGDGGVVSIDGVTGKTNWKITRNSTKPIHVDSTPVLIDKTLYFSSIYKNKGLYCADVRTGKITCFLPLDSDIKNDLIHVGDHIVSFDTTAKSGDKDRNKPTTMRVFNPKTKKFIKRVELRGHNFFISAGKGQNLTMGFSSGDVIRVSVPELKISYLNVYPEPFMSSSFKYKDNDCLFSTLGRLNCYDKAGKVVLENRDNMRAAFGDVAVINKRVYIPTRIGYLTYD